MRANEVRAFLTHLALVEKVSVSTQNQAFSALLLLFREVLRLRVKDLVFDAGLVAVRSGKGEQYGRLQDRPDRRAKARRHQESFEAPVSPSRQSRRLQ